ncbi:RNA methyltransferase, TrmH family [Saccharicrinis carchari]|uniref:RNA methyltransferase, TrmH family n=1 Tax=Saccharicrinis carchari TaxID=1168039 RepID=A0A521AFN7_SACCC|nr:TrmH family RNA methyltransferase [Saccharicrinis carchari]SMO33625.1 RNA methyltransferase, TrmH family [Saccharicrinis carchari]
MTNSPETKSGTLFSSLRYSIAADGPVVVAYQLKSPENMGHIIRVACNFGCAKVLFIGHEQSVRHSKIKKVAGAAAGQIEWLFCDPDNWKSHIPIDYDIVAIETVHDSANLMEGKLPKKMVVVLGNEIHGLPQEILAHINSFYHIPMIGAIKSMNVSQACSVALYEWLRQNLNITQ